MNTKTMKKSERKDFACQECGKRLTLKQAKRALFSLNGCPGCGGADIDLAAA